MIIDFHTHCYPKALAAKVAENTVPPQDLPIPTANDLLSQMAAAGIDLSVVLPVATRARHRPGHQSVCPVHTGPPSAFLRRHPPDSPDALELLEELAAAGVPGVKFHPPFQHFSLDDPKYRPVYRKIGDLGLITVIHPGRALPRRGTTAIPAPSPGWPTPFRAHRWCWPTWAASSFRNRKSTGCPISRST